MAAKMVGKKVGLLVDEQAGAKVAKKGMTLVDEKAVKTAALMVVSKVANSVD